MMLEKMNQLSFWYALKTRRKLLKLVSEIWSAGKVGCHPNATLVASVGNGQLECHVGHART